MEGFPIMSPLLCVLLLVAVPPRPELHFLQVAPVQREADKWERSPKQERAVVLIHGLRLFFKKEAVLHPEFRDWQEANSPLVKRLGQDSDVYSFAYAQSIAADEIGETPEFGENIQRLKKLGYKEIVVLGYSAGGLIARRYVEDFPDGGVTKVVQICTPNGGSGWAKIKAVRAAQLEFLDSLTKENRLKLLRERVNKVIPEKVQFVCVVGTGVVLGDGFVSCKSQWTEELQEQGIPALAVSDTHRHIMHSKKSIDVLAELVREPQPRWDAKHVAKARKEILGN
jgi:pimeloyl-ACP methyl ester carboxylesterase